MPATDISLPKLPSHNIEPDRFVIRSHKLLAATKNLVLLLVTTFLVVMKTGYRFMYSDQTQYLLKPFSIIKPNFAPNDWYLSKAMDYHYPYTLITVFLHKFFSLEKGVFGAWLFFMFLFALSIYQLTTNLTNDKRVFFLTLLLVMFSIKRGWGGYSLFGDLLIPAYMAVPLFLFSMVFMIKNNYLLSGMFFGLSALMHIQYGVIGTFVYGIYFLIKFKSLSLKKILYFTGGVICLASYSLVTLFKNFFSAGTASNLSDYKILFFERSPHHFIPSYWGNEEHIQLLVIICLAIYAATNSRCKLKDDIWLFFSGIILFLCAVAAFFTEIVFNPLIVLLFFWRLIPIVILACFIYGATLILDLLNQNGFEEKFWGCVVLLSYLLLPRYYFASLFLMALFIIGRFLIRHVGQFLKRYTFNKILLLSFYILYLELILLLYCRFNIHYSFFVAAMGLVAINELLKRKYQHNSNLALGIFVLPFLIFQLAGINQINFNLDQIHPHKYEKNYEEVMDWVKTHTKPEDNFIIPTELQGFRLRTGRGILVNWKCPPAGESTTMVEWKKRMDALKDFDELTPKKIKVLAQEYKSTYFLAKNTHKHKEDFGRQGFENVFQNIKYTIYSISYEKIKG